MVKKNNTTFSTPNTALAAYLISEGFELLKTNTTNPQEIVFIFDNTLSSLAEAVRSYNMGIAEGNIPTFYINYKKLVAVAQRERKLYGKEKS
jgi:hypothetical protein